jgi:hypothetical protein
MLSIILRERAFPFSGNQHTEVVAERPGGGKPSFKTFGRFLPAVARKAVSRETLRRG